MSGSESKKLRCKKKRHSFLMAVKRRIVEIAIIFLTESVHFADRPDSIAGSLTFFRIAGQD